MREHLISAFIALVASGGYFLLLDFARPALEERRLVPVWWAILALYATLVFGIGFMRVIKARPKLSGTGFLLFLATLFLYDPTINTHLKPVGLGWLWIASLIVGFLWLLTLMKIILKDQQRGSGRFPPLQ
jgi:hypothetical protein